MERNNINSFSRAISLILQDDSGYTDEEKIILFKEYSDIFKREWIRKSKNR